MSPIPATSPLERALDALDCYGEPAMVWADGSPKPASLIADDWKCERARRAHCQLQTEEEAGFADGPTAVMLREYIAAHDDAQEAHRVIKAAKAQRRREYAVVPPSSEVVRHAEAQKSHGRHSGAARESHGGASRTRGSRRSSNRGGDSGDGDGGSGSDEPPGLRCRAWCGNAKKSSAGQAKYCDRPSCNTARATDRQRKSRQQSTVLSPRTTALEDGVLAALGIGERWIAIAPEGRLNWPNRIFGEIFAEDGDQRPSVAAHLARRPPRRIDAWQEDGRERTIIAIEPLAYEAKHEPGYLWLRGDHQKAECLAQAIRDRGWAA